MMKSKLKSAIVFLFALGCCASLYAIPARRGQWKTVKLANGTEVRVEARGDEHFRYWQAEDGTCYVKDRSGQFYRKVEKESHVRASKAKRMKMVQKRVRRVPGSHVTSTSDSLFFGKKRGLIILVQFTDKKFSMSDPKTLYTHVANTPGYKENGFKGSVRDYFLAQSDNQFDLTFDVVGPVTLSNPYSYYGNDDDVKVGEMVREACLAVDKDVNFAHYDWDGDNVAEEVFLLYAGYGQADHSDEDEYIWPHMFALSGYDYYKNDTLRLDNTVIDVYACANEMNAYNKINGIGTICHEFSHCMGFPDMYDTKDGKNCGMGSWDLMDNGCYNDDGYLPAGYTGYEKMVCGWTKPVVLTSDTTVTDMKALSSKGQTYVLFNPAHADEYYVLENRQKTGYDASLPGKGMLITHIDYDETLWDYNTVNSTGRDPETNTSNTHQRATIFHADNRVGLDSESGDAYPYRSNNSLSNTSKPAAIFYNPNANGRKFLDGSIYDIKDNGDGTMSFKYKVGNGNSGGSNPTVKPEGNVLLYETFDQCSGTGGNDGQFKGSVASAPFNPDLQSWTGYTAAYGGDKCARFGKSSGGTGEVVSPTFEMSGDVATLSFKAAAWDAKADGTTLLLTLNGTDCKFVEADSKETSLEMKKGEWTTYTLKLVGKGNTSITFAPAKRFFLDDVSVVLPVSTGISVIRTGEGNVKTSNRIYSVTGRYVGTELDRLPRGIYIVGGKKIVK